MPNLAIDEPPALPAAAVSQMSAGNPFSGMGDMIGGGKPGGEPPVNNSAGALKAQIDAVKKVLEKVVQSSRAGKTFFSRAMQLLDQGLQVESQQGPGSSPNPKGESPGSPEGGSMSKPPAASFQG